MIDKYIIQNREIASRVIGKEVIMLTPEDGMLHTINETGALIWKLADGTKTGADISSMLSSQYGISAARAQKDVESFLKDLKKKGIIYLLDNPIKFKNR